jgi:hypothetical protein
MSSAYIALWDQPQIGTERSVLAGFGDTLDHAASRQFRARGVTRGDRVYIVGTRDRRVLLLGRLTVERIVDQATAERRFPGHALYRAPDHILGRGTRLELDRVVPEDIVRKIRRESGKPIKIDPRRYRIDPQSLRTTGRITDSSAALLDHVLGELIPVELDQTFEEGSKRERRHLATERSPAVRAAALALQGTDCRVCGFSYADRYGSLGVGFAEVHHLKPLGSLRKSAQVNPKTDVIVVCGNCHRMLHRTDPPLMPDELRARLRPIRHSRAR